MTAQIHPFAPGSTVATDTPAMPHNIPVEQALLGAILVNNEALHRVSHFLQADHFYEPAHGRIYAACERLVREGRPASPVSLNRLFSVDEGLKDVGGNIYLAKLAASVVSVLDIEDYARTTFDLWQRRAVIVHTDSLRASAYNPASEEPASQLLADARAELDRIADGGPNEGEAVSLGEAATEVIYAAQEIAAGRIEPGIKTELDDLDRKLGGLKRQALVVLAARPSMGKTALAVRIAGRAAKQKPDGVVPYFSMEEARGGISARLLASRTGIPYEDILNGRIDGEQIAQLTRSQQELPPNMIIMEQGAVTLEQIRARSLKLHRRNAITMVVIDHMGLMRAPRHLERADRRHHIEYFSAGLKALAKELDAPVLALSQLNRQVEQRDDKRPRLADLRESGSIEQDADVVLFVFREEYYVVREKPRQVEQPNAGEAAAMAAWEAKFAKVENTVDIIIDKARHGSIGSVPLFCQISLNRFSNLARRDAL